MAKITAIIDIGSNSIRLVIYEKSSRFAFNLIHESKHRVRIAKGAYNHGGELQVDAIERALLVLQEFKTIAQSFNARKILAFATSAVRDAPNRTTFINRVKQQLKINIKILDGEKEAFYGALAAKNLLYPLQNCNTVDIGGGSCEIATISAFKHAGAFSYNLGTVRLKELFIDKEQYEEANVFIANTIATKTLPKQDVLVGIGGTFRALSKVLMREQKYPLKLLHAYSTSAQRMVELCKKVEQSDQKVLKQMGIKKERLDVILPGAMILRQILEKSEAKQIVCSGVGVREGYYLYDMLRFQQLRFPSNFNVSVRYLLDTFHYKQTHHNAIAQCAKKLYTTLCQVHNQSTDYEKEIVIAAKLCDVGLSISCFNTHNIGAQIVKSALRYQLTHEQIILISTLIQYQKRKRPNAQAINAIEKFLPKLNHLTLLSLSLAIAKILHNYPLKKQLHSYVITAHNITFNRQDLGAIEVDALLNLDTASLCTITIE